MEAAAPRRPRGLWGWLDDRLGIGGLRYPVPKHANSLAYTLGGITLVSFVLLVVTGIYLAQFYDPTAEAAHASVAYITDTAFAGALVRSLHYWLASAFVITLILHMVRTFATGAFKARAPHPRGKVPTTRRMYGSVGRTLLACRPRLLRGTETRGESFRRSRA